VKSTKRVLAQIHLIEAENFCQNADNGEVFIANGTSVKVDVIVVADGIHVSIIIPQPCCRVLYQVFEISRVPSATYPGPLCRPPRQDIRPIDIWFLLRLYLMTRMRAGWSTVPFSQPVYSLQMERGSWHTLAESESCPSCGVGD
jgi:hypothetical protein